MDRGLVDILQIFDDCLFFRMADKPVYRQTYCNPSFCPLPKNIYSWPFLGSNYIVVLFVVCFGAHFAYRMFSLYQILFVILVISHFGFGLGIWFRLRQFLTIVNLYFFSQYCLHVYFGALKFTGRRTGLCKNNVQIVANYMFFANPSFWQKLRKYTAQENYMV